MDSRIFAGIASLTTGGSAAAAWAGFITSPVSKGSVDRCRFETLFVQPQGTPGNEGAWPAFLSFGNRPLGDAVAIPVGRRFACRGRRHQYGDCESNGSARVGRPQTSVSFPNSGGRSSRL